jgi:MYXO-CTERM domain-containing protein
MGVGVVVVCHLLVRGLFQEKGSDVRNLSISLVGLAALAGTAGAGTVFFEDFENGHIGQFTYEDYQKGGSAFKWDGNGATGDGNYTDATGSCAMSNSDASPGEYDHAIVSPVIALGVNSMLSYRTNYQNFANLDFADTDISLDGVNWKTLQSWNGDHGGFYSTPGEGVSLDLSAYDGQKVQIRFHHYDPNTDDNDWYWQVDDVRVTGDVPAPGAAALLGLGGLVAGRRRRA